MISLLVSSSLIAFLYADSGYETYEPQSYYDGGGYEYYDGGDDQGVEGCCECTESSNEPYCNEECDNTICPYDPYCCNEEYGSWDWICANSAVEECQGTAGGDYGCQDSYDYDYYGGNDYYDDYGDYDQCNCDEICYGQEPEDWEFEYEEVPPCIIDNCGQQLDTCANDDSCVEGIEGMVSSCYANNEDPMQCMDGLVQDTENNGFNDLCDGNDQCGADLKSLGECVVNSANYGFCPEEEYKKLKLKSVLKTIKKRSRSRKRKSAAAKQKLSRKSRKSRKSKRTKKRGKRASKLRKSRRKLQSSDETNTDGSDSSDYYYDDYENPEYDYGCYCDCGDEEEEIPDCIIDNCGEQLYACGASDACISGVEGVVSQCYEDNDSPQECMDELMQESNGAAAIELCGGDEEAAGDLQALGTCVINSANYGFCSEDEYKKLKIKSLVKATKKVRARKAASKQRKARSSKRARSSKLRARSQRQRSRKVRPRSRRAASQRRARAQRSRKARRSRKAQRSRKERQRSRKSRRKLQSVDGCCECTESSGEPSCNEECDNTICSYDPYCCNEEYGSWDWICANAAVDECDGTAPNDDSGDSYDYGGYSDSYQGGSGSGDYGFEYDYPASDSYNYDNSYNDYGGYTDSYYNYEPSDSYNYGGYDSFYGGSGSGSGDYGDSYYNYGPTAGGDDYGTDSYYGGYDGDSYQMQDSYDYGDYGGYGGSYDTTGYDSYYPPKQRQRQRRVRPRSRARAQRQRRQRSRSRARVSRAKRDRRQRQRRARPVKRQRQRSRRQRARRARR